MLNLDKTAATAWGRRGAKRACTVALAAGHALAREFGEDPCRRARVLEPPCCVGRRTMGEQFAVLMFFENGKRSYVRPFVSAQEAYRAFEEPINRSAT
jgi:hypothetical protein